MLHPRARSIDLDHRILPNSITLPGIVIGLLFSVFSPGPRDAVIGVLLGGGVLDRHRRAYYLVRREEGMGMGDVKMLAMIGAFLGWKRVLVTLVLSSFTGALVGVVLISRQSDGLRYAMPFGTFLSAGAIVASLVGDPLVAWYAGFLEGERSKVYSSTVHGAQLKLTVPVSVASCGPPPFLFHPQPAVSS